MRAFVGAQLRIDDFSLSRFEFRVFEIELDFFDFCRVNQDGNGVVAVDAFDDADEGMPVIPASVSVSVVGIVEERQVADGWFCARVD